MVLSLKSVYTNRPCFWCLILYKMETQARSPLSKMHCMRMENGVVQLLSLRWKMQRKVIGYIPNPFERLIQYSKMENEVSKKKSPKRHDSSCVAVNITLQTLLLFDYFTGVQGDLSLQIIFSKILKAQPKCFPQQSAICCFNSPCSIERFSKSVSSVSALQHRIHSSFNFMDS